MILRALTGIPKHVRESLPTVTIAPVLHRERTEMWVWESGRQELYVQQSQSAGGLVSLALCGPVLPEFEEYQCSQTW